MQEIFKRDFTKASFKHSKFIFCLLRFFYSLSIYAFVMKTRRCFDRLYIMLLDMATTSHLLSHSQMSFHVIGTITIIYLLKKIH